MHTADRAALLRTIDRVIAAGPYRDDWASLTRYRVPEWYRQAKFGIFIHWGVYSVPAFRSEWYPRNMYILSSPEYEYHLRTFGPPSRFGYKDFIPLFKAERFDADRWADLFQAAGARYVIPVAEHHDGFQMYASDLSEWNAAEKGPCRDVIRELRQALDGRGIPMGVSSHRIEHWWFMGHGREFDSDVKEPLRLGDLYWPAMPEGDPMDRFSQPAPSPEFMEDWLLRCCELVDRFHPAVFYLDWWVHHDAARPYLKKFAAYYYNRAEELGFAAAINYKYESFAFGSAVPDMERGHYADAKPYFWQTCTAIARNSWGYTAQNEYKSARSILCDLIDVVSKNGAMLLNVGPKAEGTIGEEETAVLKTIGNWLKVNGEAIYGTSPWRVAGEGPTAMEEGHFTEAREKPYTAQDIRFTAGGGHLYAMVLAFPPDGRVTVRTLGDRCSAVIDSIQALGSHERVDWRRDEAGLHLSAPFLQTDLPAVFKINLR